MSAPRLRRGSVSIVWILAGQPPEMRTVDGWFIPPRETAIFAVTYEGLAYTVSHIPTGRYVAMRGRKSTAVAIMRSLTDLLQDDPFWQTDTPGKDEALRQWKEENPATWSELMRIIGRTAD